MHSHYTRKKWAELLTFLAAATPPKVNFSASVYNMSVIDHVMQCRRLNVAEFILEADAIIAGDPRLLSATEAAGAEWICIAPELAALAGYESVEVLAESLNNVKFLTPYHDYFIQFDPAPALFLSRNMFALAIGRRLRCPAHAARLYDLYQEYVQLIDGPKNCFHWIDDDMLSRVFDFYGDHLYSVLGLVCTRWSLVAQKENHTWPAIANSADNMKLAIHYISCGFVWNADTLYFLLGKMAAENEALYPWVCGWLAPSFVNECWEMAVERCDTAIMRLIYDNSNVSDLEIDSDTVFWVLEQDVADNGSAAEFLLLERNILVHCHDLDRGMMCWLIESQNSDIFDRYIAAFPMTSEEKKQFMIGVVGHCDNPEEIDDYLDSGYELPPDALFYAFEQNNVDVASWLMIDQQSYPLTEELFIRVVLNLANCGYESMEAIDILMEHGCPHGPGVLYIELIKMAANGCERCYTVIEHLLEEDCPTGDAFAFALKLGDPDVVLALLAMEFPCSDYVAASIMVLESKSDREAAMRFIEKSGRFVWPVNYARYAKCDTVLTLWIICNKSIHWEIRTEIAIACGKYDYLPVIAADAK